MGHDYVIEYKKRRDNAAADALSRVQENQLNAISKPVPLWIARIKEETKTDSYFQVLHDRLQKGNLDASKYKLKDDIFWRKGRILLGPTSTLRNEIFTELHVSPTSGHSGFYKTAQRIAAQFYWTGY